ncbi:mitochondrial carrier [Fomitiporia mediterranea MF3/22]|uniref:mitochondrial carrier n=1 Tax=Fomitiporia mediterranea (strain MF3/22) TaxID=694068 RepID=UPI00044075A1|nr:mitochondrial carrier [Fomitiporia mediterranea MF3/22]EJD03140.1 mitochondrial carrier [Fomitiporia mediterranea MF3/22]
MPALDTRQQQQLPSLVGARHPAVAQSTNAAVPVVASSSTDTRLIDEQQKPRFSFTSIVSPQVSSYFIAGGVAGAVSRTVVSPLERLKIIQQVQPDTPDKAYRGVWRSLVRMWQEEGFKGFMRGNGINCLRIVPYSAVQFTTYEQLKKWFTAYGAKELDTPTRLLAGALAGITSVCTTYPLDLVRSRLSIATASSIAAAAAASATPTPTPPLPVVPQASATQTSSSATVGSQPVRAYAAASAYHTSSSSSSAAATVTATSTLVAHRKPAHLTMLGMTRKVMAEEGGFFALYRGLPATAFGVAPYVGINFAAYEALRGIITPPGKPATIPRKLACGALAGSISQTLTYPMDVLRRKMQVTGMKTLSSGVRHRGAVDALRWILRHEGVRGLYKGLWPNLLKVAPSIATSFFTYEFVKELLLA